MTTARQVTAALLTLLRGINGAGSYTYDLTGDNRVVIAEQAEAWQLPQVLVHFEGLVFDSGFELTQEKVTATYRLVGFVSTTDDTGEARLLAAVDLMQDMLVALRADRSLGGLAIDSRRTGTATLAYDEDGTLYGIADLTVTVVWQESAT